jgi:hypothetical protein
MNRHANQPLTTSTFLIFVWIAATAVAQEVQPQPTPPANNPQANTVPRVRITYYVEGETPGWKERFSFDLTEWTPEKDVIITQSWKDDDLVTLRGTRTQVFRTPKRYSEGFRTARSSTWKIEYVEAGVEDSSRVIIEGFGGRYTSKIYGPDDSISLLKIPNLGWQELGLPARLARRFYATRGE